MESLGKEIKNVIVKPMKESEKGNVFNIGNIKAPVTVYSMGMVYVMLGNHLKEKSCSQKL